MDVIYNFPALGLIRIYLQEFSPHFYRLQAPQRAKEPRDAESAAQRVEILWSRPQARQKIWSNWFPFPQIK